MDKMEDLHILKELFTFGEILFWDTLFVPKLFLYAFVVMQLESMAIERVLILMASNVGYFDVDRNCDALVLDCSTGQEQAC